MPDAARASTAARLPSSLHPTKQRQNKHRRYSKKKNKFKTAAQLSHSNDSSSEPDSAAPSFPSSMEWRRVPFDADLLQSAGVGDFSGLIQLEEISGSAFQNKLVSFNPKQFYEDNQQQTKRKNKRKQIEDLPNDSSNSSSSSISSRSNNNHPGETPISDSTNKKKKKLKQNIGEKVEEAADVDDINGEDETEEAQQILQQLRSNSNEVDEMIDKDEKEEEDENQQDHQEPPQLVDDDQTEAVDDDDTEASDSLSHFLSSSPPPSDWDLFSLHPLLLHQLHSMGFRCPTPIQTACLPVAITQWKDVIAAAETGSGKTLAFGLPILNQLLNSNQGLRTATKTDWSTTPLSALILTPTRELALQISHHLQSAAQLTAIRVVSVVGGISLQKQQRLLSSHPHIIVGTPGRLYELMISQDCPHLNQLHQLRFFVLDEADRMVALGHFPQLEKIIQIIQKQRNRFLLENAGSNDSNTSNRETAATHMDDQTHHIDHPPSATKLPRLQHFFFSATLTLPDQGREKVHQKLRKQKSASPVEEEKQKMITHLQSLCSLQSSPAIIDLTSNHRIVSQLAESSVHCLESEKDYYIYAYILSHPQQKMIVFVNAISCVRRLGSLLSLLNLQVYPLHAEMQQRQRLKNLERFNQSSTALLVCSDVAARGLDLPTVPLIIHYQLPLTTELYIHRCGRSARAGASGVSLAIISERDTNSWKRICKVVHNADPTDATNRWTSSESILAVSHQRMDLARKIDQILNKQQQQQSQTQWFFKHAQEMDLPVDDDLLPLNNNKKQQQKQEQQQEIAGQQKQLVKKLTAELQQLLKQPVNEEKQHRGFYTLNIAEQLQNTELKRRKQEQQHQTQKKQKQLSSKR